MTKHLSTRAACAAASLAVFAAVFAPMMAQTAPAAAPGAALPPGVMPTQPPPMDLSKVSDADKKSYLTAYGWVVGQRMHLKQLGLTADEIDQLAAGMKVVLTSGPDDIPGGDAVAQKAQEFLEARFNKAHDDELAKQNDAGKAFFADLDKKPEVKKTASGLYYQIITPGTDPKPTTKDTVSVKYTGTLLDGSVFDQTKDTNPEGPTRDFDVDSVVPGMTEGLQLIGKGGKIKLYIPAKLGYGDDPDPRNPLPPGATLTFEVEIVNIKPQAPAPNDASSLGLSPEILKQLSQPPAGSAK